MADSDAGNTEAAPTGRPVLLFVDDEPSVLNALRRLFRSGGYEVLLAPGGREALDLLATRPVDLVVSDMRMPGMDGAALLEAVRQRHPATVRILLTGYADIGATIAAINRGEIHRYIAKPWVDEDLLLAVRDALSRRALQLQHDRLLALTQSQNLELQAMNGQLEQRVAQRTAELEQINGMLHAAYDELNGNFTLALTVFSGLMELRQDGMAGHSRRVAALARRVAEHLAMDERARQDVFLAALLHDIGKIGFPDRMLAKPVSTYSPEETQRYRRHPVEGEAALLPLAKLHGAARIVRQHHERIDGHGYPDGLAGDTISLGARIVAVASDYDGLLSGSLSERRYTEAMARQSLQMGIGTRYDARVVAALFEVLAETTTEAVDELDVDVRQLQPGMVLAQDLLSSRGVVLLVAGFTFDARVIHQVNELVRREDLQLNLRIRSSSLPAAMATGPLPRGVAA